MNIERNDTSAKQPLSITLSPGQVEQIVGAANTGRRLSRSLLRGLSVLACFGPENETLGLMEIAECLQISASTIHRYVITLVAVGLLEQSQETRKYSLPSVRG